MAQQAIDVKELIGKLSTAELIVFAERYWQQLADNPRLLAKPFSLGDAEHILPQLGFLVQGLQLYPNMTVLDFGAGSCFASRILNQMGLRVISMDVSNTALEIGRSLRAKCPPVGDVPEHIFCLFDGRHFDLPDGSVDRIFCLDAFHHVADQGAVLREMGRVLKDGGIAGFAEPGPNHSKSTEAQLEMRNCCVIESDVVLSNVQQMASQYGFTALKVSISPIHPPLIPLENIDGYLSHPAEFIQAVHNRVINFPIFFLYKGDPTISDSRNREGLAAKIIPAESAIYVRNGDPVRVLIDVINSSSKLWLASGTKPGCVNVGAMLGSTGRDDLAARKEYRFALSQTDVKPGSTVTGIRLELGPLARGEYRLEIDLVSEHVCWFQSQSQSSESVTIHVP